MNAACTDLANNHANGPAFSTEDASSKVISYSSSTLRDWLVANLEDVNLVQDWLVPVPSHLSSQVLRQLYEQTHVILNHFLTNPYLHAT